MDGIDLERLHLEGAAARLERQAVVGRGGEDAVGHDELATIAEGLDAGAIDEEAQADGAVARGGGHGHGGEVGVECGQAGLRAIHDKLRAGDIVMHVQLLALVVRQGQHELFSAAWAKLQFQLVAARVFIEQGGNLVAVAHAERGESAGIAAGVQHLGRGGTAQGKFAAVAVERQVAGDGVGAAVLGGGQHGLILPVAHPAQGNGASVGGVAEGDCGVVILAPVHPLGLRGRLVLKRLAVERADEVLRRAAAEGAAGIDVAEEHPLAFVGAFDGQFDEVGTLPHAAVRALVAPEGAGVVPVDEVLRGVDFHLLPGGENHAPMLGGGVPEYFRVAEVGLVGGNDGITCVLGERAPAVGAIRHALRLAVAPGGGLGRGVERDDGAGAEACGVIAVDHARAAEDGADGVGRDGDGLVLPVHEVGAGAVSPRHVAPRGAVRVVLEIEVPGAIKVEHTVGVVHPSVGRRVVEAGAEGFAVLQTKRVGQLQFLPAAGVGGHTLHLYGSELVAVDGEVEGHVVVDVLAREADVDGFGEAVVVAADKVEFCLGGVVLHGQEEVAAGGADGDDVVLARQVADRERVAAVGVGRGSMADAQSEAQHRQEEKFLISFHNK